MESIVDVTTTVFQAILAVAVVFTAGYVYNGKHVQHLSTTLLTFSRTVLLPCFLFTTFAGSSSLTWKVLLQQWPAVIIALLTHVSSLVIALLAVRSTKAPTWTIESVTFQNVGSYPLLLLYALAVAGSGKALDHLRWRSMDTIGTVVEHATVYILINLVITELARFAIKPFVDRQIAIARTREEEDELETGGDETDAIPRVRDDESDVDPDEDLEADERTPLVASLNKEKTPATIARSVLLSPIILATLLGLLIGLIKPVQRFIVGQGGPEGTWIWGSVGLGLRYLGGVFALLEIIGIGAKIRAGANKHAAGETVPPTLGTVLLLVTWRYIATPAIVISVIRSFRKIPSTKAYLQDPAFSFVLALTSISPPVLPIRLGPFNSSVLFSTFYTVLITAFPLAIAIAVAGRGVSTHLDFDLVAALRSAGGGGLAGAAAMVVQVLILMPLRTIMNYQYRYGGGLKNATKTLWNDGGFKRYYAGLAAALFQGPLSRFGDTAANAGILALLASFTWPVLVKTIAASVASACFRMTLTPIDTLKTTQQTQGGVAGLRLIRERIKAQGVASLWYGALATAAATFVGHYPWFGTYNFLSDKLPPSHNFIQKLARQAFIGFSASVVSDTSSNSLRVVKTYRQVHEGDVGYLTAAKEIVASEGLLGLFGRGLPTRLLTNGLQGLLFSILWKLFADL
ncbi:mitochondrial carrier protein [Kwoniella heveanensis BCC8398]|uniref:Mitochondrial carrier protein n=1 Tax=Kwoniella heveanensis BCC8398 TaxID=1296120 RepID=A0A1B9GUP2_9TREE|nr:mitochondrial carrier protein [Kwoniella heveanensis BCC8398]